MTLRTKLTVWYVCALFGSLLLCSVLLFREWVLQPHEARKQKHEEHERAKATKGDDDDDKRVEKPDDDYDADEVVEDMAKHIFWIAIPAAILGLGGGWWLMRAAMAPVTRLTKAAEQMNEGNLRVQLPLSGSGDELDRLTVVFNEMAARLDDSFRRIREFTLRASHELKTPLTVMRGSMETALNEQQLAPAEKERLAGELDEVDRLAKIVDGLTLLTKADAGLVTLKQERVPLAPLMREIHGDGLVLARPAKVEVRLEACEEAAVTGDNNRLRQMLLNLVDNAIKYNIPGGHVSLALKKAGGDAEITVSNTGPGVPAELLPRLFDPFFRGDEAHAREKDGSGLGLAIVRWIVQAHKGSVEVTSLPEPLTTVRVRLPLRANES